MELIPIGMMKMDEWLALSNEKKSQIVRTYITVYKERYKVQARVVLNLKTDEECIRFLVESKEV